MNNEFVKRMNAVRQFPNNTCSASRLVAEIAEALCEGKPHYLLEQEPIHCGESMAAVVESLWKLRASTEEFIKTYE